MANKRDTWGQEHSLVLAILCMNNYTQRKLLGGRERRKEERRRGKRGRKGRREMKGRRKSSCIEIPRLEKKLVPQPDSMTRLSA